MLTPPAGLPPALAAWARSVVDALTQLQQPGRPAPVCPLLQADLPPAADWPTCVVLVTDLNILAHSDGSNWIREDTGAPI
ncbi:MAG TPA: hypothetical protein PKX06_20310 [Phenylobacterium sp.]|nr:hypothetical protein [Phenylobacterium sp.]